MKKLIYILFLPLVVVGGLVFANREFKNETAKKPIAKPLTAAEMKAARKQWDASPDGVMFKKWEESPAGKKVYAAEAKIRKFLRDSTSININDEDFILSFGLEDKKEFEQLRSLKVNDKIIIKSHSVMHAPKYTYPIVAGNYVERDSKILYKRPPRKGGC
jgi:hypothetical protein